MRAFILFLIILPCSCSSLKNSLVKYGGDEAAVQNAILDFSERCNLYKEGSVFKIWVKELKERPDLLVVTIGKNSGKILHTKEVVPGSKGKAPSRYFEINNKLFYWWDDNYPLSEQTLAIFKKYNLLQDDQNGLIKLPHFITDDGQKAAHYYFCKNNLTDYKRVVTNKGIGYYNVPALNCTTDSSRKN